MMGCFLRRYWVLWMASRLREMEQTLLCSLQFIYLYEKHLIRPAAPSEAEYYVTRMSLEVGLLTHYHPQRVRFPVICGRMTCIDPPPFANLLQLLGEMLLQRQNYENMMRYATSQFQHPCRNSIVPLRFIRDKHNLKVFLRLTAR